MHLYGSMYVSIAASVRSAQASVFFVVVDAVAFLPSRRRPQARAGTKGKKHRSAMSGCMDQYSGIISCSNKTADYAALAPEAAQPVA